jgi:AcrR family transcriptional regulator
MPTRMRKDAARSRRAILDAARELYADDVSASFAEIALGAGVGQATVYRHFDDRQALLAELAVEDMGRLEGEVEAEPIGPGSFESLLREMVAGQVRSQGLIGAIRAGEVDQGRVRELTDRCRELFRPRLEAARAAGVVRGEVTIDDVMLALSMIAGALESTGGRDARAEAGRRAFEIVLDGLRSEP